MPWSAVIKKRANEADASSPSKKERTSLNYLDRFDTSANTLARCDQTPNDLRYFV